jgi:hypothetical protein
MYFAVEVFYDYRTNSWNRNVIQIGVDIPVTWVLSIEPSFIFQNSMGSEPSHVRALGLTLTLSL